MNSKIPVKVYFLHGQEGHSIRRFSVPEKISFTTFQKLCEKCLPEFFSHGCQFEYVDDEGEWVTVGTQMEWEDAVKYFEKPLLRVKISKVARKVKRDYLKRTPKEKFVLACMRNNKAPVQCNHHCKNSTFPNNKPWKKVNKGTQTKRFDYLRKTPNEKYKLPCMRANKPVKREKPPKKKCRGWVLKELCDFLNWPTKNADLTENLQKEKIQEKKQVAPQDEKRMYAVSLAILEQMGFKDEKKNIALLKKYNGNIQHVVHESLGLA